MQGMIHHHAEAVEMTALLRTRSYNKELQELGKRISISQTDEIDYMRQWLEEFGQPVPVQHDKVLFTDEWGGGGQPRCRATDPMN